MFAGGVNSLSIGKAGMVKVLEQGWNVHVHCPPPGAAPILPHPEIKGQGQNGIRPSPPSGDFVTVLPASNGVVRNGIEIEFEVGSDFVTRQRHPGSLGGSEVLGVIRSDYRMPWPF